MNAFEKEKLPAARIPGGDDQSAVSFAAAVLALSALGPVFVDDEKLCRRRAVLHVIVQPKPPIALDVGSVARFGDPRVGVVPVCKKVDKMLSGTKTRSFSERKTDFQTYAFCVSASHCAEKWQNAPIPSHVHD